MLFGGSEGMHLKGLTTESRYADPVVSGDRDYQRRLKATPLVEKRVRRRQS